MSKPGAEFLSLRLCVLTGDLDALIARLQQEHQADELARLTQGA